MNGVVMNSVKDSRESSNTLQNNIKTEIKLLLNIVQLKIFHEGIEKNSGKPSCESGTTHYRKLKNRLKINHLNVAQRDIWNVLC